MNDRTAMRRVPGVPRARLHPAADRRARRLRALTGASDWRRRALDAVAFGRVALAGAAGLPPAPGCPWPGLDADRLALALRAEFPALVVVGAVTPRQPARRRLSLLCHAAGNPLIVKLGDERGAFETEHRALELLVADPLPGIATPRPCGVGTLPVPAADGSPVAFVATAALGLGAQRPAVGEGLRTFESDLASRLGALATPPPGASGLVPVHGDLTPWNLRRTGRGLALFDWEAAGWGEPGSDLARYRRASAELGPRRRRRRERRP